MPWISAYTVVLILAFIALGLLVGRMRGDSAALIAINVAGGILLFFGMAWASSLGDLAFGAAAVATLGAILATVASERSRFARRSR